MTEQENNPSLHIDGDWKAQAKAEKQKLAEETRRAAEAEGGRGEGGGQAGQIPPANFQTLMSTFVTQALMAMGAMPDPMTGRRMAHLELAKFYMDMLEVLQEKTEGNLSDEESKSLSTTLHELRMNYMQLQQMIMQQRMGADGGQGAAGGGSPLLGV